jgi:hypothetical protein
MPMIKLLKSSARAFEVPPVKLQTARRRSGGRTSSEH